MTGRLQAARPHRAHVHAPRVNRAIATRYDQLASQSVVEGSASLKSRSGLCLSLFAELVGVFPRTRARMRRRQMVAVIE